MPVLSKVWNFVKRNKKKLVVLGLVVGGAAIFKRYFQYKLGEWQANATVEYVERMKHDQHFESTRQTCKSTIVGLLPNLRDRIAVLLDCEAITKKLMDSPNHKVQLWEELRSVSFARLVSEIYGASLLITFLNVQLNVIGGYMFVDATTALPKTSLASGRPPLQTRPWLSPTVQQKYLAVVQRYLESGIEKLSGAVYNAVYQNLANVSLKESLTLSRTQELLNNIRQAVEGLVDPSGLGMFRFVLPEEEEDLEDCCSSSTDTAYSRILNETRDLLESKDCAEVLASCINSAFSVVADALVSYFVDWNTKKVSISTSTFPNPNEVNLPLAKVIPIVTSLGNRLFDDLSDEFVSSMFACSDQQIFGANIYETFSQPNI